MTTCECGHHEAVHRAMCGAPEGCGCNKFVPTPSEPVGAVDAAVAWIVADKDGRLNDDEITTWEDFAHERVKEANRQAPLLAPWRVIPLYTTPPRSPATVTEAMVMRGCAALDNASAALERGDSRHSFVHQILTAALGAE